jgi:putative oxidoreductase
MNLGILIARLVFGLLMAAHGTQKLFGWLGGYGLEGTGGYFQSLGFRPGRVFAFLAGAGELVSGLLLALGLFGPVGGAIMLSVMIVAIVSVHAPHGLFAATNGIELPLLYAMAGAALALTGNGAYALDALLGIAFAPGFTWAAVVIGIAAGFASLGARRRALTPSAA